MCRQPQDPRVAREDDPHRATQKSLGRRAGVVPSVVRDPDHDADAVVVGGRSFAGAGVGAGDSGTMADLAPRRWRCDHPCLMAVHQCTATAASHPSFLAQLLSLGFAACAAQRWCVGDERMSPTLLDLIAAVEPASLMTISLEAQRWLGLNPESCRRAVYDLEQAGHIIRRGNRWSCHPAMVVVSSDTRIAMLMGHPRLEALLSGRYGITIARDGWQRQWVEPARHILERLPADGVPVVPWLELEHRLAGTIPESRSEWPCWDPPTMAVGIVHGRICWDLPVETHSRWVRSASGRCGVRHEGALWECHPVSWWREVWSDMPLCDYSPDEPWPLGPVPAPWSTLLHLGGARPLRNVGREMEWRIPIAMQRQVRQWLRPRP